MKSDGRQVAKWVMIDPLATRPGAAGIVAVHIEQLVQLL